MGHRILVGAFAIALTSIGIAWGAGETSPASDIAAGSAIAARCVSCHGSSGISPGAGVAHIAGQHAKYLQSALIAYKNGTRKDEGMHQAVGQLSERDIGDLAAYYASLTGFNSRPGTTSAGATAGADQDPFAETKKITAMCAGCHGEDGNSTVPTNPSLAGQHDAYLITAIEAYQKETRSEPMMQALVKPISRSQIEDIAYFYAAMVPRRNDAAAEGDAIAGMAVAEPCASCHGKDGNSTDPKNPRLAGLSPDYLIAAINAYRDGSRKHDLMRNQVLALRDQDVKNLAAYYAAKEPQALAIRKPLTLVEWTARCNRCHGTDGNSTDPRFPVLAGQDEAYLTKALELYHGGERESQLMSAMSFLMAESDIKKLAAYYAQQRQK
jgi:cytochrome c553